MGLVISGSSGVSAGSVTQKQLNSTARPGAGWRPTGAIAETMRRGDSKMGDSISQTSGTLYLYGGIVIPGGVTVSSITFCSANAASGPTHQWFCLVDQSLNVLAKTAD